MVAFLVGSCVGCGARSALEFDPLVDDDARFAAYLLYGAAPAEVVGVDQPEVVFHAIEGPAFALDGDTHVVDMSQPGPWVFRQNLLYAADVDICWYVIEMDAGRPGVTGEITVRGTLNPLAVDFEYHVGFVDPAYPMPCFSELVDIGVGGSIDWMATADAVTLAP